MAPTKKQRQQVSDALAKLQDDLAMSWIDKSLPKDWNYLDSKDPIEPHKTRVTMRLDTDMVKWFRKLGHGYQKRINQILRVYYTSVIAGEVQTHYAANAQTELRAGYYERMNSILEQMSADMEAYMNGGPPPPDPRTYMGSVIR